MLVLHEKHDPEVAFIKKDKKKLKFAFISFRTALFLIAYSSKSVETPIVLIEEVLLVVQCNSEPVIINVETMTAC